MALTRDFRQTVQARVRKDEKFRRGLLRDAIEALLAGEEALGREILRDFINATMGFPTGRKDRHSCEDAAPDVRSEGESDRDESLQHHRLFARTGRRAVAGGGVDLRTTSLAASSQSSTASTPARRRL